MAEIKQEIIDIVRERPYIVEKDIKSNIDSTEQNIATQLRQLIGDEIITRIKNDGVFRYFLTSTKKTEEPKEVEEVEEVEEPVELTGDNDITKVLGYIIENSPTTIEEIEEATGVSNAIVRVVIESMVEEKLLVEGEDGYSFNSKFDDEVEELPSPEAPEIESVDLKEENGFGEDLDETYDKFMQLVSEGKISKDKAKEIKKFFSDMDSMDQLKEIKALIDSYDRRDELYEMAIWNDLLDLIERNPGLSEKELGKKSIEEAEQTAVDNGTDPKDATGINPQTLAIQLRRLVNQGDVKREKEGKLFKYFKSDGTEPAQVVSRGNVVADVLGSIKKGNDTERKIFGDVSLESYSVHTLFSAITKLIRSGQIIRKGNSLIPRDEEPKVKKTEPKADLEDIVNEEPKEPAEVEITPEEPKPKKEPEEDLEDLISKEN